MTRSERDPSPPPDARFGRRGATAAACVLWVCLCGLSACGADDPGEPDVDARLKASLCDWKLHPDNPLIEPPGTEWLIGDPTVLTPGEAPDGRWHLYANSVIGIHHHVSDDGLKWTRVGKPLFGLGAFRAFILKTEGGYAMFYEKFSDLKHSNIRLTRSVDLASWSTPTVVLEPTEPWEKEGYETVSNPYVTRHEGRWRMYYSTTTVMLEDAGFPEPRYIAYATSDALEGPWDKQSGPLIAPSKDVPWRNHGAGSMKLLDDRFEGRLIALNNGIYLDAQGKTRSAIAVLSSLDGQAWAPVCDAPVIAPTDQGWMAALVYAFDTARDGDTLRLYFNARDGWTDAFERIGVATLHAPAP